MKEIAGQEHSSRMREYYCEHCPQQISVEDGDEQSETPVLLLDASECRRIDRTKVKRLKMRVVAL
jgi:hypothetical protein